MRLFSSVAFAAFIVSICAVPITPAAPELQRRAEQFRLQGFQEHEIAAKLQHLEFAEEPQPFLPRLSARLHSIFHHCPEDEEESGLDLTGDIAPGSMDSPEMLPRAAIIDQSVLDRIVAFLRREEVGKFAYEGKELELRRPTGMRHWGSQDKWRLY